jgi:hypothetical protein
LVRRNTVEATGGVNPARFFLSLTASAAGVV